MVRAERRQISVSGIVQGVGFRPFVVRLAARLGVAGSVFNDVRGVEIEVQGEAKALDLFQALLVDEAPPMARIEDLHSRPLPLAEGESFVILPSRHEGLRLAPIPPDADLCDECRSEMMNPGDRRYLYPFINCTNCGPRFSLVTGIPYDRPQTTMSDFPLCSACAAEYHDPLSRRFHAQPIACPDCGPKLTLVDSSGDLIAGDPLLKTIELLRSGRIVAIKGLGGYHLAVDACNDEAVNRLRQRKHRDEKPFALMVPSLDSAGRLAEVAAAEAGLLSSPERPIVLLQSRNPRGLSPYIAPYSRYLGLMLPYTPLHHLLLTIGQFEALVMTSGNQSDEPIVFDEDAALHELGGIADAFLSHNRRIHTRIDDSIVRVLAGKPLVLRRARGFVPKAIRLPIAAPAILALGGELKNTFCLTRNDQAYLSQHLGDLGNLESCTAHLQMQGHLQNLLELKPEVVVHDLHPDYQTTRQALSLSGIERIAVQHHHAHLASCLAENGELGQAIGVIFDGTGYGLDGTIWGGEFLLGDLRDFRRVGSLMPVAMPGGDAATREPWRMALSYLFLACGRDYPRLPFLLPVRDGDEKLLLTMIERGLNSPRSSSCGRLFDAVAALIGLRRQVSYEGQAAIELEMAAGTTLSTPYDFRLAEEEGMLVLDPRLMVQGLVTDLQAGVTREELSRRFHGTLVKAVVAVCLKVRAASGVDKVALSGGVFQNRLLTEGVISMLEREKFKVLTHTLVPPNDGGLSFGQAAIAAARLNRN